MCDTPCGCDKNPSVTGTKPAKVCRRCGSEPHILFDSVHLECKTCFLESCAKKIRSTIGKTQLLKNNDKVVLAYSGGPSSLALLELLKDSIEKNTSRREQKLKPSILHIETRTDLPLEARAEKLYSLLIQARISFPDWPLFWMSIDDDSIISSFHDSDDVKSLAKQIRLSGKTSNDIDTDSILASTLDKQLSTDSEKDHFERMFPLQRKLVEIGSRIIGSDQMNAYVFIGDNATRISNNVMKSVIFGQGDKMNTLAEVSYKFSDLGASIMRPLRDFSARELAFYLRLKGIEQPVQFESTLPYSRIADKTESYLAALDVLHSSTYSTLTGVATRMRPKHNNNN